MNHRFLLWIDAVGGYLICSGDRVRIGQHVPGQAIDVPLVADVARHHATIRRDGESYLIEPVREVSIDGRLIEHTTHVVNDASIELGRGVKLAFRRPHPLSQSARLDLVSRHRTQPATSGIVLMAGTCILGPGADSHIVCRDWSRNVVLHATGDGIYCIVDATFTIDGVACRGRGLLGPTSHVVGDDFTFSVESLAALSASS